MVGLLRTCQVCSSAESKYKCPTCRLPYCSVACYRNHKAEPCHAPAPELAAPPPAEAAEGSAQPAREFEEEDGDNTAWRLPRPQLIQLAESAPLRGMLQDHELQRVLLALDVAADAETELESAMANPLFKAFADQVQAVIGREEDMRAAPLRPF